MKQTALAAGLAVTQPEKIRNNAEFRAQLEAIAPDAIVVVAYGRIIPPWMLALPRLGCINLHASLLPKYRGAAPIQWAVAMGETVTGNTTMLLEEGLDTGPILLQQTVEIAPEQTAVELFDAAGPRRRTAGGGDAGRPRRGNDSAASRRITRGPPLRRCSTAKTGAWILRRARRTELKNRWRGFQPWPGAFTALDGKKLIVHRLDVSARLPNRASATPGRFRLKTIVCLLPVRRTPGSSFSRFNLKARSASVPGSFCVECSLSPGARLG